MSYDTSREQTAVELRRQLATELEAGGSLTSDAWRAAVESVPRHSFVPRFYREIDAPGLTTWKPYAAELVGDDEWLRAAYADESLITQFDGHEIDWTDPAPVRGATPTSSSTMPSLVVRMLERLDVEDGHRVLEIGTGTGYSTALLCQRLGAAQVTSIEYDAYVAAHARKALTAAGYRPRLVVGDGLSGDPAGAPYDRIIATCGVRHIPHAWVEQTGPGGVVLATVRGWMRSVGLVRLDVADDGTAEGRFLDGDTSFMIARQQDAPPSLGMIPAADDGETRIATHGPEVLTDPATGILIQLTAPDARYVTMSLDGSPLSTYVLDTTDDSFTVLSPRTGGGWTVRQGGPARLWDTIESTLDRWDAVGRPPADQLRIRVTPSKQTIWHPTDPTSLIWSAE